MTNLYLVRHGETDLNATRVYFGSTDVSINEAGIKQCILLGQSLKDVEFDLVITSALRRTVETAKKILNANNVDFVESKELNEFDFGTWEKLSIKEIEDKYPEGWKSWIENWSSYKIPQGESFDIFYNRVSKEFYSLMEANKGKNILIIGHKGVLRVIATLVKNEPLEKMWEYSFDFGKWYRFEF